MSGSFYRFVTSIEHVYSHNLTAAHLDAYPTTLAAEVKKLLMGAERPRRTFCEEAVGTLPLEIRSARVPEEFYSVVLTKWSMMRVKDLARKLHESHAGARARDPTAGNQAHRPVIAVKSGIAKDKRSKRSAAAANLEVSSATWVEFPHLGAYLERRRVAVLFENVDAEASDSDEEAGEEIGDAWMTGVIDLVEKKLIDLEQGRGEVRAWVAWVVWDNGSERSYFAMRAGKYWHGAVPGSWKLLL